MFTTDSETGKLPYIRVLSAKRLSTDYKMGTRIEEVDTGRIFYKTGPGIGVSAWKAEGGGSSGSFKASIDADELIATTVGISINLPVGVALGGGKIMLRNLDGSNFFRYAYGTFAAEAITNAATGPRVLPGELLLPGNNGVPELATFLGLLSDTADVLVGYTPGV